MIQSKSILEALDSVMREPMVDQAFACPKCDFRFTGPSRVPWLSMILCPKCGSRIDFEPETSSNNGEGQEDEKEEKPKKKRKKPKKKEPEPEPEVETETSTSEKKPRGEDWESELDSYLK
jgi:hypothetical protein